MANSTLAQSPDPYRAEMQAKLTQLLQQRAAESAVVLTPEQAAARDREINYLQRMIEHADSRANDPNSR